MKRNVLVLNGGVPYQIASWEKAIENIFEHKSYVLEEYKDFPLHAGGGREIMKCPAVVMLKEYIPYAPIPKYCKTNVFQRDDFVCQYCGIPLENRENREIDHIIPKSHSNCPGSTFENVVLSCTVCNRQKADKLLSDMKKETCWNGKPFQLIKKPIAPKERVGVARFVAMVNKHNLMWLDYIHGWEKYAKRLGKDHLFGLYDEYLKGKKPE